MRGTILAAGMILAADGNRYSYRPEDIQPANGEGRPAVLNRGDEVEFIAHGQAAKEICLANTRLIGMNASAGKNGLALIRMLGMTGAALAFLCEALNLLAAIPSSTRSSCWFAGIVFTLMAIIKLSNKTASTALKKNYIIFLITIHTASALILIGFFLLLTNFNLIYDGALIISGIIIFIYARIKEFQVCNELSRISGNPFFLCYFICIIANDLIHLIYGNFFFFAALILQIIAWYQFRDIKAA